MAVFSNLQTITLVATIVVSIINPAQSAPHKHTHKRSSTPFDVGLDEFAATLEARGISKYINFAGIAAGHGPANGQVPIRQEFRVFQQDPTNLNLYLRALNRMMTTSQTNSTSFYQLGGIHGRPFKAWDGVTGDGANTDAGYCTHADILFPTWHRPYMALYEQTLWNHAQDIAREFPAGSEASTRYLKAAPLWRMPYWDWAANAQLPDSLATATQVYVETPTGMVSIDNPLYSYKFNPINPAELPNPPFNTMKETVRNPDLNGRVYTSNPQDLNAQLANIQDNLRSRVYTILTAYTSYLSFSNKATTTSVNGQFDSLESIHDTIHGVVGGNGGHMGVVDYAAMDPLFYLHHTNIDRLFAIWQAINPTSFVSSGTNAYGTFAYPQGMTENANTPLMPFHQSDGTYWTSNTAANVKNFGYTYPELVDWSSGSLLSATALKANVIASINKLYGTSQPGNILSAASNILSASSAQAPQSTSKAVPAAPKTTSTTKAPVPITTSAAVVIPISVASIKPTTMISAKAPIPTTSIKVVVPTVAPTVKPTPKPTPTPTPTMPTNWWSWNNWPWMWRGWKKRSVAPPPVAYSTAGTPVTSASASTTAPSGSVDAVPPVDSIAPYIPALVTHNYYQEYLADISVANAALNGTFSVYVFLGDFTSDPSQWALDPNLVGTHAIFAMAQGGHNTIVAGSVPLTASLINRVVGGQLASLNTTSVVPYLAQNLHWKVRSNTDKTVDASDVMALEVQVVSSQVQLPASDTELPVWGPMVVQYKATQGKPAGLNPGQQLGGSPTY